MPWLAVACFSIFNNTDLWVRLITVSLGVGMQALNDAYWKIANILGEDTEALESVQLVEKYRCFLKPEKVRVVLLAESHVFTSSDDRKIVIPPIPELPGYPTKYARFVYCLGYGERSLTNSPLHPKKDGTPQFWKILYSCRNPVSTTADFAPILSKTAHCQRLQNKITLLKGLKANGIWLVDASIVALYKNGKKTKGMFRALQESWQSYTRDVVISSSPEHVICIGKGVAGIVESDLRKYFQGRYTVVPQPNAHLSSEDHLSNFMMYSRICCQ
jgi:hypothetical protein